MRLKSRPTTEATTNPKLYFPFYFLYYFVIRYFTTVLPIQLLGTSGKCEINVIVIILTVIIGRAKINGLCTVRFCVSL